MKPLTDVRWSRHGAAWLPAQQGVVVRKARSWAARWCSPCAVWAMKACSSWVRWTEMISVHACRVGACRVKGSWFSQGSDGQNDLCMPAGWGHAG